MRVEVINFLKKSESYVSGEELAQKLGLTRQALWKHIQELKSLGYEILAVPHLGYRLEAVPDRLYSWEVKEDLNTEFIGKKFFYYEKVNSTMDIAWELAKKGLPEGSLVCAEYQTQGRGRLRRKWVSPRFKGIYFSLILRPEISPFKIGLISLLSAVGLVNGIKRELELPLSIKWPNDILVEDKKVAGVLTELDAEKDRVNFVIVGCGLNINTSKRELPENATSLSLLTGRKIERVRIFRYILQELEKIYLTFKREGENPIINNWRRLSYLCGKRVKVIFSNRESIEARVLDIDPDGALLVRNSQGIITRVLAGDIEKLS